MHTTIRDWTKLVALCAVFAISCTGGSDGIINPSPQGPPSPPHAFTAGGTWQVQGNWQVSYRFSSRDDGEIVGDFTGTETDYGYYYQPSSPVSGHWEQNRITFTVRQRTYSATMTYDNPTRITFGSASGNRILFR